MLFFILMYVSCNKKYTLLSIYIIFSEEEKCGESERVVKREKKVGEDELHFVPVVLVSLPRSFLRHFFLFLLLSFFFSFYLPFFFSLSLCFSKKIFVKRERNSHRIQVYSSEAPNQEGRKQERRRTKEKDEDERKDEEKRKDEKKRKRVQERTGRRNE